MEKEKQFLTICAVCGSIRVNNRKNLWLKKDDEEDFKLYDLYMGNTERVTLSHGYCQEDYEKELKKYDL